MIEVIKVFLGTIHFDVHTEGPYCARPPFLLGEVELPTKFSKRERGLTGLQFLEGVAGNDGVTFFRVGVQFLDKKKLKSGIFNDKKGL